MNNSYRDIFKGTTIIGGSSFIKLLISMAQTKFVAIFLGTLGVGLVHSYTNISGMVSGFCNFGIGGSAVRYISEAAGENGSKEKTEAITAVTFFLTCCVALLTFLVFAVLSYPLALLTFKDASYTPAIILLGVIAVVSTFGGIPGILLQSHRKLAAIAASSVIASMLTSTSSILVYYFFRVQGILIALMLSAAIGISIGWYYVHKFKFVVRRPTKVEIKEYSWPLIKLGSGFFLPGLYNAGLNYINNLILLRYLGLEVSGLYYCAMNLSGALANFVLNAMGTDYYPRLVQVVHDRERMEQMVNNQLDVGVHLAIPGLFLMIVFAPLIIFTFYTKSFVPAILPLQLLTVGVLGRVISWPTGYVLLAKADMKNFFVMEFVSNFLLTAFLFLGTRWGGLNGAAAALGVGYLIYIVLICLCVYYAHGISFGRYNIRLTITWNVFLIGCIIGMNCIPSQIIRWSVGIAVLVFVSLYCLRHLMKKMALSPKDCIEWIMRRKQRC